MKIRNEPEFLDIIDRELSWRRNEISILDQKIIKSMGIAQDSLIRSAICIVYSHWEGYIKKITMVYLHYVACKSKRLSDLRDNFSTIMVHSKIKIAGLSKKYVLYTDVTDYLSNRGNIKFSVGSFNIDTSDNLDFEVFKDICKIIDVDINKYSIRANLIDKLVKDYRNAIVHGSRVSMDLDEYREFSSLVKNLIVEFQGDVKNMVQTAKYLR